jgi:hypothetical protein
MQRKLDQLLDHTQRHEDRLTQLETEIKAAGGETKTAREREYSGVDINK